MGSLPKALDAVGVDAQVVTPAWKGVIQKVRDSGCKISTYPCRVSAAYGHRVYDARVHQAQISGVTICFLESELYECDIYPRELDERTVKPFAVFCLQALELEKVTGWSPDIFHCHDWTSAFLSCALAWHAHYRHQTKKSVLTLHNVAYQGIFTPGSFLSDSGLQGDGFTMRGFEFFGYINLLKGGIVAADAVTTVSPRYAWEIQTYESTQSLSGVIHDHRNKLRGILNGIDVDYWDPSKDSLIPECYSLDSISGKGVCRKELLKRAEFDAAYEGPLVVSVSRLVEQKGFDIILPALHQVRELGAKFIFLGSGHQWIEDALRRFSVDYQDSICFFSGYDEPLAHLLYAGGDIYLMPSLFEPCGLSQLIAMRYGTVPVVREVGGLIDTVIDADTEGGGNGFSFISYDTQGLLWSLERAVSRFSDSKAWSAIRSKGMKEDFSWQRSAVLYRDLYKDIL